MEPNPSCVLWFVEVGCPGCGAESGSDALWGPYGPALGGCSARMGGGWSVGVCVGVGEVEWGTTYVSTTVRQCTLRGLWALVAGKADFSLHSAIGAQVCSAAPWCLGWGASGLALDAVSVWLSAHGVQLPQPLQQRVHPGAVWSSWRWGGHSVYCSPGMAPGLCCTPALGYPHVQRRSGCCGGPLEPSMGEKATRRWIVGVSPFSPFRGKSLLPTCSVKSRDEWELLEGPPCTPSADCLLHIPPPPLPVLCVPTTIMQSCNQGAELAAHLGLISKGCKFVPTRKKERWGRGGDQG